MQFNSHFDSFGSKKILVNPVVSVRLTRLLIGCILLFLQIIDNSIGNMATMVDMTPMEMADTMRMEAVAMEEAIRFIKINKNAPSETIYYR